MTAQPTHIPIWRLVELVAQELTLSGCSPFTRKDLIARVQRVRPDCGPDSINPIIQGVTDNLRGGAPGAVGREILHSVGRGQFVLRGRERIHEVAIASKPEIERRSNAVGGTERRTADNSSRIRLAQYEFDRICEIEPRRTLDGRVEEFLPQSAYRNFAGLPLNRYGVGPFCRFQIPRDLPLSGVYAITVDREVRYIGECANLSARYNAGYGLISPRNCYRNGQETNWRINNLLLGEAQANRSLELWFLRAEHRKHVEQELVRNLLPRWNLVSSKSIASTEGLP